VVAAGLAVTTGLALTAPAVPAVAGPAARPSPTPTATPRPSTHANPHRGHAGLPRDRAPDGPLLAALPAQPPLPTRAGLTQALRQLVRAKPLGKHVAVAVEDPRTGRLLYGHNAGTGFIPASTTKLLTITAALSLLGPDHRFTTRVVDGGMTAPAPAGAGKSGTSGADEPGKSTRRPAKLHTVVLVGGGDPLLSSRAGLAREHRFGFDVYPTDRQRATIDDLAARTATSLRRSGIHTVTVRYDASLFGQSVSPHWRHEYVATSVVSPVSALWVDEGRIQAPYDRRAADPAADAAERFIAALRAHHITVRGRPTPTSARTGAAQLAQVSSPPLREIAEHVLKVSDNDGAEVLARQVALAAGRRPDFAGAVTAVEQQLRKLGIDLRGVRLYDGSGLSRDNRIPARTLVGVLALPFSPDHRQLASVLTDLPIGGFDGSLRLRYVYTSAGAAGYVRAKTGTLTGVSTLAGTVSTRGGAVLTFAVMTNRLTRYALPAIDRLAARLAACGCR
jgi:D-alanyl-D-alanine carboxypeptidase/D-alanyl-D-alanine-endopeptidase (penicillin-binding protein 4)